MGGDAEVKLLLQAFQLSLGCCMEHPTARMLREQMLARLVRGAHMISSDAFHHMRICVCGSTTYVRT